MYKNKIELVKVVSLR